MRRFFLGLWIFTALFHLIFFGAAREALARAGVAHAGLVAALAAAAMVALFRFRLRLITQDRPVSRLRRALELLYYTSWCGAVAASCLYVVGAACWLVTLGVASAIDRPLPALHGSIVLGSYAVGLILATYGVWIRARRARVRRLEIPVRGLSDAFDGYRIVQLSDLHIGSLLGRRAADRWIAAANAEAPDLVALTGDYVTNGVLFHREIADVLAGLRAKDAIVATLGNHDYFGGGEPLATLLGERGIVLLRNQRHTIARAGAQIEIAGADDTWTRRADVERTMRGFGGERPLIALTHDPSLFPDFVRHRAALVLAGHTHWGQVGVPFAAERVNLARRVFRFSAGLYRENGSTLYVNPGLGTTGPPIRFGSPPEITVFVLRCT